MGAAAVDGDLLEIAEALYALALADFTPHRDARVRELRSVDRDLAARVKALRKPSTAAWVVNLLARRDAEQLDGVLDVGVALREAQAAMSADDLRALTRQRRQLTAAVAARARALASEDGLRVSQAVADQVEATLTAAILDESCAAAVRSGMLVTALSTTGVGDAGADVAAAVAVPEALGHRAVAGGSSGAGESGGTDAEGSRPDLHVVPDPDAAAKAVAAARERLAEAEEALQGAAEAAEAAEADVARLEARSLQVQSEIEELRSRLASLEAAAEEVDDELADAEDVRDEATGALDDATRDRDEAAAGVRALEG